MSEVLSNPKLGKLQLLGLFLIWLICGIFGGPVVYLVVPLFVFFMANKRLYLALLLGFFFILILAASRVESLIFAENLRSIYLLLLGGFILFDPLLHPLDKTYKFFIPFFIVALLSLFNSDIVILGFAQTVSYFLIVLVVPTSMNRIYENYADEALKYIIYFGIFVLSIGLVFWGLGIDIAFFSDRYRGIFGNPNGLGIFTMLFFFLLVIINTYHPSLFSKKAKIIFYIIIIVSLLLSQSRSALGATLIFIFFAYFYKISKAIGFLVLLAVIVFSQFIFFHLDDIILALDLDTYLRLNSTNILQSGSGRLVAYEFAWEHIKQNIWIGGGMGYTTQLFHEHAFILNPLGHQGVAHNTYLTIWLDTGIFGLIFFAGAWFLNFMRASMHSYLAYPILFGIIFSISFESWLVSSINAFTIILLIILSLLTNPEFIENNY